MRYRRLGASDLEVSEISLGADFAGGAGDEPAGHRVNLDRASPRELLGRAVDDLPASA